MLWLEALCGMAAAGTRGRTHVELWGLDTGKNVTLPKYMPNLVNQHSTATMDFTAGVMAMPTDSAMPMIVAFSQLLRAVLWLTACSGPLHDS